MIKIRKTVALLLSLSMFFSMLSGCAVEQQSTTDPEDTILDSRDIVDTIPDGFREPLQPIEISYNWEDYVGNLDTLVYGLIVTQYELCYDVFNAVIDLPDGTSVYGIGYSDFSDYYESDDGSGFFPAGFIRLIGEPEIPAEYIDSGLEIQDIDNETDYSFVYAYEIEPYMEHCVVWNQYLKYGINASGQITYEAQPYQRGTCDESLGSLYSYDEGRYVFEINVGNYTYISGTTLSEQIDYDALQAEINRILEEQDINFASVDIESSVYFAQEAVNAYLLSLQEETFVGCKVSELIEAASALDPMECIRITPDGIIVIDVENDIPDSPSELAKWLVGMGCGIVFAGSIALEIFVPAMRPASGAISGAAMEVFMQVVMQNHDLDNVNWTKVAVAATSGALLAWACPLAAASTTNNVINAVGTEGITLFGQTIAAETLGKLSGYAVLTFSNAIVSGAAGAAFDLIDGKSAEDAFNSFLWGAAIGGACTIAASALSELGNAAMNALEKSNPNNWLVKAMNKVNTFVGNHQIHLNNGKLENILAPKSVYEAAKCAVYELNKQAFPGELIQAKLDQIPSDDNTNFIKVDNNGNLLSKGQLRENGGNCIVRLSDTCDSEIQSAFANCNVSEIVFTDGVPDFSSISVYSFVPSGGIGDNRTFNMEQYYEQLANDWGKDSSLIPDRIRTVLADAEMEDLKGSMIRGILSRANLTPHEGTDGFVYLVDSFIHSKVGHFGGVALAKMQAKLDIGSIYLKQLINRTPVAITGTLIIEGVG